MPILTCPACKQQLGLADENLGAVVRCPSCNATFSSRPDVPPTAVRAQAPPPLPSMQPTPSTGISDRANLPSRSGEPDYDQYDSRWTDDDPLSIKRKNTRSQAPLLFGIFGGLFIVGLVVVGLIALLRPGGLLGRGDGIAREGPHDLLSLAPADSVVLFGLNVPRGQKVEPIQVAQIKELIKGGAPAYLGDLILDAERVVFAGNYANDKPTVLGALLTKTAYDREKIKKEFNLGPERIVQGASIHTMKMANAQVPIGEMYVAMPEARVLVVGVMPEAEFVKALLNQGKPPVLSDVLLARARELEAANGWAVVANQGVVKDKLQELNLDKIPQLKGYADEIALLQRSRTVSLVLRSVKKDVRVEFSVECANDADGKKLQKFIDDSWKATVPLAKMFMQDPKAGRLLDDLTQTFKVALQGNTVTASAVISEATGRELEKLKLEK